MLGSRRTVHDLLAEARDRLERLSPAAAWAAAAEGAVLVDVRDSAQRRLVVPGAVHVDLTVLEWRADPASGAADPGLAGRRLVLLCREGYSSSLAASRLRALGLDATDVEGGIAAWIEAGLPVEPS